jgi:predicted metal-dependent peptidase
MGHGPDAPYEPRLAALHDRKRVAVGIDVSGSISTPLLRRFASEIAAIGKRTGAELHVLVFDTAVRSHRKLAGVDFSAEVLALDFARGGGTSFVEVVDRAAALDPSIVVILTDLYGPFGAAPRGVPVLWCVSDDGGSPKPAPFGRTLRL